MTDEITDSVVVNERVRIPLSELTFRFARALILPKARKRVKPSRAARARRVSAKRRAGATKRLRLPVWDLEA